VRDRRILPRKSSPVDRCGLLGSRPENRRVDEKIVVHRGHLGFSSPRSRSSKLPERARAKLENLSAETDRSLSEVIRRALAVSDLLGSESKKGGALIIRNPEGEREVILAEFQGSTARLPCRIRPSLPRRQAWPSCYPVTWKERRVPPDSWR
jgi:hypothetical protein